MRAAPIGWLEEANGRAAYAVRVPADPAHQPREEADRWVLPTGEGIVTQLQIDFAFGLTIDQWLHIRIEGPFVVHAGEEIIECEPERPASIAPLVELHQVVVSEAAAHKDGSLTIAFADGHVMRVAADQRYEAFAITGSRAGAAPFRLISLPGGGLAEWLDAG